MFRLWKEKPLDASELKRARTLLIKFTQRALIVDLQQGLTGKGKFKRLAPIEDSERIWRVGSRMQVVIFIVDA